MAMIGLRITNSGMNMKKIIAESPTRKAINKTRNLLGIKIILLLILCTEGGCVAISVSPKTATLDLVYTPTPLPTLAEWKPTCISTPTSAPVFNSSWLRDVTVFYEYGILTHSIEHNKAEGVSEIWRVQADGSGKQRLVLGDKLEKNWIARLGDLVLSHDGRRLAFIQVTELWKTRTWSTGLWVINIDGSGLREWVGQNLSGTKPGSSMWSNEDEIVFDTKSRPGILTWSLNDNWLAFVDLVGPEYEGVPGTICLLNSENGELKTVGEGEIYAWSPDGKLLAVRSQKPDAETYDLRIVDLDGKIESVVTLPYSLILYSIDWSKSRNVIVAEAEEGSAHPILIIDPVTGEKQIIIRDIGTYWVGSPQWSPDGSMILVERYDQADLNLYILDPDTGQMRLLFPQVGIRAIWSPDSKWVLVQSEIEGKGLYIVSVVDGQYWKIPNVDVEAGGGFNSYDWWFPPR